MNLTQKTSSKTADSISILELSDVHLGHRRTDVEHIFANIRRLIPDNEYTASLDMIIIAGDLFDRDLTLHFCEMPAIVSVCSYILHMCIKHDIVLRVLEGTPSHDWKQSKLLVSLNETLGNPCDLVYHEILAIEYISKFDMNVLYVPDEWRPTNLETQHEVEVLLSEHKLEQVDYSIMHGCFPHQLPSHLHDKLEMHDPEYYLSITKYYIFIGHIHQYSQYERILSAGSTDRLCHGEEEPKGCLRVDMSPSGNHSITFIENVHAKLYIDINCGEDSLEDSLEKIRTKVENLKENSYVRIIANASNEILASEKTLKREYPEYHWTFKLIKEESTIPIVDIKTEEIAKVSLNKDSILSLMTSRFNSLGLDESYTAYLTEVLDYVGERNR